MAGEPVAAAQYYRLAAAKTGNLPERNYLLMKAARLTSPDGVLGTTKQFSDGL
jgi:hypothetical protein